MLSQIRAYLTMAGLVGVLLLIGWALRLNDLRDRWHHQYESEHAGRMADRATYEAAQKQATADNRAHVQKVEQQYQRNSDDARQAYLSDLSRLRADNQRMRAQGASAAQGSANRAGSPEASSGTPRIDDSGVCVPATSDVCEAGAEIELRLMHLQNLYSQQTNTDPNK